MVQGLGLLVDGRGITRGKHKSVLGVWVTKVGIWEEYMKNKTTFCGRRSESVVFRSLLETEEGVDGIDQSVLQES